MKQLAASLNAMFGVTSFTVAPVAVANVNPDHNGLKAAFDAGIEDAVLGRTFATSIARLDFEAGGALRHWYGNGWDEGTKRKAAQIEREAMHSRISMNNAINLD